MLEEFRITLRQELDYEREARDMVVGGENLGEFPLIQIPQPVADYSTRRVLTMDYVRGRKITAVGPLGRMEMDGEPLAEQLLEAYLKQVLVDGLFHADPHPGNVFLTDGGHLALLDLGMVGHTTPAMQDHLFKVLMAISEGRSDEAAEVVLGMSRTTEEFDEDAFRRGLAQMVQAQQNQELSDINMGRALLELSRHAADNGLRVPSELTLLGKTLLQLSDVGKLLDPAFDANAAIRRHVGQLMSRRMVKELSPGNMLQSLLEVKDLVTGLPRRLVKILEALSNRDLEVKVKAVDAPELIEGFRSIANRITAGVVLAALIVGAALLMRVETTFRLWGYPGLAILCFLAAAAGGVWLLASIASHDRPKRRKPPGTP